MEEKQRHKEAASDFTTLLYQKGYRGKYTLLHPDANQPNITSVLSACLEKLLTVYRLDNKRWEEFELSTHAPYNDNITCRFKIAFDPVKGFQVRELTIEDKVSRAQRYYRLSNNQQVPGANSIEGLFPKSKPWDDIAKGKFRPKR